jgi:D-alanyl-D-alanine carboxypeptidase (penicillin-binding protein 5/6)
VRTLVAATALALVAVLTGPIASALPDAEPVAAGVAGPPDGPAQAWLVADLDTGRVLAAKDPNGAHAPASTIKTLLALVVVDHLNPNSFARASCSRLC